MSEPRELEPTGDGRAPRHVHPPIWLLLHAGAALALDHWMPLRAVIPAPWTELALVPGLLGAGLVLWCIVLFRRHETGIIPFSETTALVASGPYRLSRNPIYVGLTLLLVSLVVLLGTLGPWLAVPSFWLVLRQRFVLKEEALLRARFGPAYEAFCTRVPRWI
jgi:protein-S-isoprenylcysteine O-methyltransferase Ste14